MAGGKPKIQKNDLGAISVGYIMIPKKTDRDGYIKTCFRNNRVCILSDGGLFKTDVYITNEALQNISFPEKEGQKGTQVILAAGAFRNQPIIIGTVPGNDETQAWSEEIFRYRKSTKEGTMFMCMDPKHKEWNFNVNSAGDPLNFNITNGGNEKSKIRLQSSGEIEIVSSKKVKVTGYDKIEVEIVNPEVEAEEPGKEIRKITYDKDKLEIIRKVNDKTTKLLLDDNEVSINFHDGKTRVLLNEGEASVSFDNDKEQVKLSADLIKMLTGKKVDINGAAEPLTLANTLINLLNNVENQVAQLKNAWSSALAGSAAMDGGKAGFTAGITAVASISPLDFNGVKSKVVSSD